MISSIPPSTVTRNLTRNRRLRDTIRPRHGQIIVVQGGQWGSEAKGIATAHLVTSLRADYCVRTGAVNAGHTVNFRGKEVKMQQLPVGFIDPSCALVIGPGALIHIPTLLREIEMINDLMPEQDVRHRLYIDYRAGIHEDLHSSKATSANRHHLIGATGKGCSEALVSRIKERGLDTFRLFGQWLNSADGIKSPVAALDCDTVRLLNTAVNGGATVILEPTQGHLLDLLTGPYPYTTHKPTSPAQWLVEAGLSPRLPIEIILVARTYPIRVAGNSGPMPGEISWPILARYINTKLRVKGLPDYVEEFSIKMFEEHLKSIVAEGRYTVPNGSDGNDQHEWKGQDRVRHRVALSELNRAALEQMERVAPGPYSDLRKLFEFTTVTKKLRRIATFHSDTARAVALEARPSAVFLTFLNYEFPELYHQEFRSQLVVEDKLNYTHPIGGYVRDIEDTYGAPVLWANTGPLMSDIHDFSAAYLTQ